MSKCYKRVIYLSCMELGSRIKGAGFIKVEHREGEWIFDMHISGMAEWPERKYEICAVDKKGEVYGIGSVFLHRGCGEWKWKGKSGELGEEGISCDEISRFVVKITDNKVIEGKWIETGNETETKTKTFSLESTMGVGEDKRWKLNRPEFVAAENWEKKERILEPAALSVSSGKRESSKGLDGGRIALAERREEDEYSRRGKKEQRESGIAKEGKREKNRGWGEREQEGNKGLGGRIRGKYERAGEKRQEEGKGLDRVKKEIRMEEMILNDKWEQLRRMYPVIHPYEDEREYISIQPKDFVVMTGDYQHLANNSFLLHGFYNYRHIVLGKEMRNVNAEESDRNRTLDKGQRDGTDREKYNTNGLADEDVREDFYLGVPGVYYEREKMVALMFGFEAFECCGGKAESGKFGYYLRRVRI